MPRIRTAQKSKSPANRPTTPSASTSPPSSTSPSPPAPVPMQSNARPRLPPKPPLAPPGVGAIRLWTSLRRLWDTVIPPGNHALPPAYPNSSTASVIPDSPALPSHSDENRNQGCSSPDSRRASNSKISPSQRRRRSTNLSVEVEMQHRQQQQQQPALSRRLRVRSNSSTALLAHKNDELPIDSRNESSNLEPRVSPSSKAKAPSTTTRQFKTHNSTPNAVVRSNSSRAILTRARSIIKKDVPVKTEITMQQPSSPKTSGADSSKRDVKTIEAISLMNPATMSKESTASSDNAKITKNNSRHIGVVSSAPVIQKMEKTLKSVSRPFTQTETEVERTLASPKAENVDKVLNKNDRKLTSSSTESSSQHKEKTVKSTKPATTVVTKTDDFQGTTKPLTTSTDTSATIRSNQNSASTNVKHAINSTICNNQSTNASSGIIPSSTKKPSSSISQTLTPPTLTQSRSTFAPKLSKLTGGTSQRPQGTTNPSSSRRKVMEMSAGFSRERRRSSLPSAPTRVNTNRARLQMSPTGSSPTQKVTGNDVKQKKQNVNENIGTDTKKTLPRSKTVLTRTSKRLQILATPRQPSRIRTTSQSQPTLDRKVKSQGQSIEKDRQEPSDNSSLTRYKSEMVREAVLASRLKASRRLSATRTSDSVGDSESVRSGSQSSRTSQKDGNSQSIGDKSSSNIPSKSKHTKRITAEQTSPGEESEVTINKNEKVKDRKETRAVGKKEVFALVSSVVVDIPPISPQSPGPSSPSLTPETNPVLELETKKNEEIAQSAIPPSEDFDFDKKENVSDVKSEVDDSFDTDIRESDLSPHVRPSPDDIWTLYNIRPASHLRHMMDLKGPPAVLSAPGSPRGGGFFVGFPMHSPPGSPLPPSMHSKDGNERIVAPPTLTLPPNVCAVVEEKKSRMCISRRASASTANGSRERALWLGLRRRSSVEARVERRLSQLQTLVTQLRDRQKLGSSIISNAFTSGLQLATGQKTEKRSLRLSLTGADRVNEKVERRGL